MLNTNVRSSQYRFYFWFIVVSYLVLIATNLKALGWGDDALFTGASENYPLFEWWLQRYLHWSGRASIDLMMVGTIQYEWFWRLFIPLSILLLAYSIVKITADRVTSLRLLLVLVLFALGPVKVMSESMFWVTGFYNYLLPSALALYCYSVLRVPSRSLMSRVLATLSIFVFAYQEQVAILFGVALVLSLYHSRDKFKWFIMILLLGNASVLFLSPGNPKRLAASIWGAFPQYQDFGLLEKVMLGLDKLYQVFILSDNWPLIIFLAGLCFLALRKGGLALSEKFSLAIVLLYIVFFFVQHQHAPFSTRSFLSVPYEGTLTGDSIVSSSTYVWYLCSLMVMFASLTLLMGLFKGNSKSQYAVIAVLLGTMSVMMMGFTPTVYMSNHRVHLMFELGLIVAFMYLLDAMKAAIEQK